MNLQALIIDDEPLAHRVIIEYVKEVPFLEIAGQCYIATEALSILNKQPIDLIFLDINLPKIKGLDFLRTLHKKPMIIITSAYEEYALESFELNVCDYLLKPFSFERFLKAIGKALELHQLKNTTPTSALLTPEEQPDGLPKRLFIKADKRLIQIDLAEVHYLESYGNYVKIWLADEFHLAARTLSSFEEQLSGSSFFRIHKSYIINKKYIDYIEGNLVMVKNKKGLPIGKNYRKEFRSFINQ